METVLAEAGSVVLGAVLSWAGFITFKVIRMDSLMHTLATKIELLQTEQRIVDAINKNKE